MGASCAPAAAHEHVWPGQATKCCIFSKSGLIPQNSSIERLFMQSLPDSDDFHLGFYPTGSTLHPEPAFSPLLVWEPTSNVPLPITFCSISTSIPSHHSHTLSTQNWDAAPKPASPATGTPLVGLWTQHTRITVFGNYSLPAIPQHQPCMLLTALILKSLLLGRKMYCYPCSNGNHSQWGRQSGTEEGGGRT